MAPGVTPPVSSLRRHCHHRRLALRRPSARPTRSRPTSHQRRLLRLRSQQHQHQLLRQESARSRRSSLRRCRRLLRPWIRPLSPLLLLLLFLSPASRGSAVLPVRRRRRRKWTIRAVSEGVVFFLCGFFFGFFLCGCVDFWALCLDTCDSSLCLSLSFSLSMAMCSFLYDRTSDISSCVLVCL